MDELKQLRRGWYMYSDVWWLRSEKS